MDQSQSQVIAGPQGAALDAVFTPFLQNLMQTHQLTGLAVGAVAGDQIVYARGFGLRQAGQPEPITARTLFHMASISKPFTATAIMQLMEAGRIHLNDSLVAHLPYFRLDDNRYTAITIGQMLSHLSGIPDVVDYEWTNPQYDDGALERYVRSLGSEKMRSNPGEKFAYSNMAYECLGAVIASVSGLTFDDYCKTRILDPLGMTESTFLMQRPLPLNWAAPHLAGLETLPWAHYPYNRAHGPSSTLHSNAVEMCCWALANLNYGQWGETHILQSATYDRLWKPTMDIGEGMKIGLSWFLGEYRGEKWVSHGGGDTGFNTYLCLLPEMNLGVVVLSNTLPTPARQIAQSALDVLLDLPPTPIPLTAAHLACRTLKTSGLAAAVQHCQQLKQADESANLDYIYDCFYCAIKLEKESDALELARLALAVCSEAFIADIAEMVEECNPPAPASVLNLFRAAKP